MTLRDIGDQLRVHRNALSIWAREDRDHIVGLRLVEFAAIRALPKYEEELTDVAEEYKRVTAELAPAITGLCTPPFWPASNSPCSNAWTKLRMRVKAPDPVDKLQAKHSRAENEVTK